MADEEVGAIWELVALQDEMNRLRAERYAQMVDLYTAGRGLPPLSRLQKFKRRLERVRERVALRIAPWLDE